MEYMDCIYKKVQLERPDKEVVGCEGLCLRYPKPETDLRLFLSSELLLGLQAVYKKKYEVPLKSPGVSYREAFQEMSFEDIRIVKQRERPTGCGIPIKIIKSNVALMSFRDL